LAVIRGEQQRFDPPADTALHEGGSLIVERSSEVILKIKHARGIDFQAAAARNILAAIQTALHLGLNPLTFAMMIAIAASSSYLTPIKPDC
jgi:hypothetical protein